MKKITYIILSFLIISFCFIQPIHIKAVEVDAKSNTEINYQETNDEFFTSSFGEYQNEKVYYSIDFIDSSELEEEGFIDGLNPFKQAKDGAENLVFELIHNLVIELPFTVLKTATVALIWLLNSVSLLNFINIMIDEIESTVIAMTGINNLSFGSSGLFGGFLSLIILFIAVYTLFMFVIKKAKITAFSTLIKSVLALIIALLFFANYSEVIKGLNNISTEASALIISGQANTVVNDNNNIENPTTQSMFSESIWNVFVHKPYLYLQYGTMNEDEIGKGRIEQLLRAKPNSDTRDDIVLKEVTERGNPMMTRTKLIEKITFQFITMFSFMINSIPVLLLSFSLLLFQFWFLAIGMIAPFVFIWGALPNQFGVIIRYFLELIIPLALKLAVSVIALVVFMLTNVLMNSVMSTFTSSSILSFIVLSWCQLALWTTFFLLRKRIFRIFSLGSQQIGYLREEIKNVYTDPLKSAVSKTATVGGAVAGGIVTGTPQGAMMGASVGGSLGGVATGENDVGSATRTVATTGMMYDRMNKNQAISDQKEAESMQQLEIQQTKDDFQEKLMSQHGIAEPMAKEATQKLHEKGIDLNAVDDELVNTSMSEIQQEIEEKRPKEDFATNFSNKVHGKVFDQKLENETNQLKSTGNIDHGKDHQTEVHADKSINTEEIPLEKLDNYSKSNNESTPLQTPKLDTNSQQFSNEPKDIPIVTEPMHQGTESGTSIEITKFDQSDVENNGINPQPIRESKINSNSPKGNSIPTNNHNTKDTQQEFIENDIPTQDIPKREVSNTGNNTNQGIYSINDFVKNDKYFDEPKEEKITLEDFSNHDYEEKENG